MKDKVELEVERDSNYLAAADGHLIIVQVRREDVANYSCVAENIVNRRISSPARLEIVGKFWMLWWQICQFGSQVMLLVNIVWKQS